MTDAPNINVENLLAAYEAGVSSPSEGNAAEWLTARSSIEAVRDDLTTAQEKRLLAADKKLVANADEVELPTDAGTHPRNEWWWYVDVVAEGAANVPVAPASGGIAGRIFTGIEVAVLLVAVFLLLRNFGVQPFANLFQPGPTATYTPPPSSTPAPTPTVDAAAFDMTQAKPYAAPFNIITMNVPANWSLPTTSGTSQYSYNFSYGPVENPLASISISLLTASDFYASADSSGKSTNPQDALIAFKASRGADTSATAPKFGDVTSIKLGNLENTAYLPVTTLGNISQGQQPAEIGFYAAAIDGGKRIALIQTQTLSGSDPRVKTTVGDMLKSLNVNVQAIPTATPTATLHPLLITATALQTQIIALTPTNTPTATPTQTATPGPGTPTGIAATVSASGLQIQDLVVGTGAEAVTGKKLTVKYVGTLTDGTKFDSSYDRQPPNDVFTLTLGAGGVIKGWDEGLVGMKEGGKRRLTIPPALGYGASGQGTIPPNATLIFEIELVKVE
jgi:hypothetical protein